MLAVARLQARPWTGIRTMRVFLAVDLHDTLGAALHDWGCAVARTLGPRAASDLSWVPAARMHATLHFFGEIERAALPTLLAALGDRVPEPPFQLTLAAGGTFPVAGRPRVLWLGFDAGSDALARLHAWIAPRVAGIGQPDRQAGFSPHLTIARVRLDAGPGLGWALRHAAARTPTPAAGTRVDAVTLVESVAGARGPTYVALARLPLIDPARSG